MPTLPPDSLDDVFGKSPIIKNAQALADAFPTQAEKDSLLELAKKLHESSKSNQNAAQTWATIGSAKDVVLKLAGMALGVPLKF